MAFMNRPAGSRAVSSHTGQRLIDDDPGEGPSGNQNHSAQFRRRRNGEGSSASRLDKKEADRIRKKNWSQMKTKEKKEQKERLQENIKRLEEENKRLKEDIYKLKTIVAYSKTYQHFCPKLASTLTEGPQASTSASASSETSPASSAFGQASPQPPQQQKQQQPPQPQQQLQPPPPPLAAGIPSLLPPPLSPVKQTAATPNTVSSDCQSPATPSPVSPPDVRSLELPSAELPSLPPSPSLFDFEANLFLHGVSFNLPSYIDSIDDLADTRGRCPDTAAAASGMDASHESMTYDPPAASQTSPEESLHSTTASFTQTPTSAAVDRSESCSASIQHPASSADVPSTTSFWSVPHSTLHDILAVSSTSAGEISRSTLWFPDGSDIGKLMEEYNIDFLTDEEMAQRGKYPA